MGILQIDAKLAATGSWDFLFVFLTTLLRQSRSASKSLNGQIEIHRFIHLHWPQVFPRSPSSRHSSSTFPLNAASLSSTEP